MTKYAANSFLATKISFMNEIANICELVGANVDSVRLGIGSDDRIGNRFLFPGIGYGGSCFPKDVLALQKTANENNYNFKILDAVVSVNKTQKEKIQTKIMNFYKNDIKGKKFALWGLSFKPDTDDIREAPSLEIINHLTANGAKIVAYDPEAINNVKNLLGDSNKSLSFTNNAYDALKNADALVIATEWSEFRSPNITKILRMLKNSVIFDGRNLYDLETMKKFNIHYESIGRKTVR
jgi:UDPglucose 6-dehydrogenase